MSHLYTDGSTAFWDSSGTTLITSPYLPPSHVSKQSHVFLRTPAAIYTSTTAALVTAPFPHVPVTDMQAFLKTPNIHHDVGCRIEIAFVLRPATSIKVGTINEVMINIGTVAKACSQGSLNTGTGFGTCIMTQEHCTTAFPAETFMRMQAITLTFTQSGLAIVTSTPMQVEVAASLVANMTSASHNNRGTAYVTRVPTTPGASFPMLVTVNTVISAQPVAYAFLSAWELQVSYNPTVLNPSLNLVTMADGYSNMGTSVKINSATQHVLTVLAFVKAGFEAASRGPQVAVCTVNFIVSLSVQIGIVIRGIESAVFTSMIDEGGNVITGSSPGIIINDITPSVPDNTADLRAVAKIGLIGIRAYTSNAHLVFKPDGNPRESAFVTVMGVHGVYGEADTVIFQAVCLEKPSSPPSRLTVSNDCTQILSLALPTPRAPVEVTYQGFGTIVDFRVHVAVTIRLVAVRSTLAKLCNGQKSLYQSTRIRKMVQFNDGGGTTPPEVDVTRTEYDFGVIIGGATQAVHWDEVYGILTGVSIGTVTLTPQVFLHNRIVTPVSITVADNAVTFGGISLFSFNTVTWLRSGLTPVFQDVQSFNSEGQWHNIVAVSRPDGDFLTASQIVDHLPSLNSSVPAVYALTLSGTQESLYYRATVPYGAYDTGYTGPVIVTGPVGGCQVNPKSVNVTLPFPVSATITLGLNTPAGFIVGVSGNLATEVDAAVSPPISVTVTMSDGSQVQAGGDTRTSLAGIGLAGITVTRAGTTSVLSQVTGTNRILMLSATVFAGRLSTTNTLSVTISTASQLALVAKKTNGGTANATHIYRIECSPHLYEAVIVTAILSTTAGTFKTVTPTLVSDKPTILVRLADGVTFRGTDSDTADQPCRVSAVYGSLVASIPLLVSTTSVSVTSGTLWGGTNPGVARLGVPRMLSLSLTSSQEVYPTLFLTNDDCTN